MKPLPVSSYVLLGLLRRQPQSGYDLSSFVEHTVAHFWPLTRGLVYRELARLEERGLLQGQRVAQASRPDKRVYEVTAAGRTAFAEWLTEPGYAGERPRNELLVRLFFGAQMDDQSLRDLLTEAQEKAEQRSEDLQAISDRLAGASDSRRYGWMTARYGVWRAQAELDWIQEMRSELGLTGSDPTPPVGRPSHI